MLLEVIWLAFLFCLNCFGIDYTKKFLQLDLASACSRAWTPTQGLLAVCSPTGFIMWHMTHTHTHKHNKNYTVI